jgi:hypothetical protein
MTRPLKVSRAGYDRWTANPERLESTGREHARANLSALVVVHRQASIGT